MKFLNKLFIIATLGLVGLVNAQQDTNYTLYRYNMNVVNAAYAGSEAETIFGANFRSQWSGVEGAPETQSFFFSQPFGNNLGLGLSVINDKTFVEKQTSVMVDFSYGITLAESTKLYLGLKAGGNSYNVNTAGLTTTNGIADPSLNNLSGNFLFNLGVGALLKGDKYFVSLSAPRLFNQNRLEDNEGIVSLNEGRMHSYVAAGYDVDLSDKVLLRPSAMLRYVAGAPISLDLTASIQFNNVLEAGASYRVNEGIGGLLVLNAKNWINIGYAYIAASQNPVAQLSNGSHEIFINFILSGGASRN